MLLLQFAVPQCTRHTTSLLLNRNVTVARDLVVTDCLPVHAHAVTVRHHVILSGDRVAIADVQQCDQQPGRAHRQSVQTKHEGHGLQHQAGQCEESWCCGVVVLQCRTVVVL